MEDDYYKILGFSNSKNVSESDIKKAYYNLAKKYHPDKASDDKKEEYTKFFQKVGEAHEVLSNKEKREIYDNYGKEGLKNGNIAENVFPKIKRKNQETIFPITLSLQESYKGISKKLKITRTIIRNKSNQQKVPLNDLEDTWLKCLVCKGQGRVFQIHRMGNMIQQTQSFCEKCKATGCILKQDYELVESVDFFEINIEKGICNGQQYRLNDQGNCSPGALPGDLIIVFQVQDSQNGFSRSGNDLNYTQKILLSEALCGGSFKILTLDGRYLHIKFTQVNPGDVRVIPREGINNGSLRINFQIVFPSSLNSEQKEQIRKILPIPENKVSSSKFDAEYDV